MGANSRLRHPQPHEAPIRGCGGLGVSHLQRRAGALHRDDLRCAPIRQITAHFDAVEHVGGVRVLGDREAEVLVAVEVVDDALGERRGGGGAQVERVFEEVGHAVLVGIVFGELDAVLAAPDGPRRAEAGAAGIERGDLVRGEHSRPDADIVKACIRDRGVREEAVGADDGGDASADAAGGGGDGDGADLHAIVVEGGVAHTIMRDGDVMPIAIGECAAGFKVGAGGAAGLPVPLPGAAVGLAGDDPSLLVGASGSLCVGSSALNLAMMGLDSGWAARFLCSSGSVRWS